MPGERQNGTYTKSLIRQLDPDSDLAELYHQYQQSNDFQPLSEWIDGIADIDLLSGTMAPSKHMDWNFKNLERSSRCGTLEFRSPPQVVDAESTHHWIAFGLSFVCYVLMCNLSVSWQTQDLPAFEESIRRRSEDIDLNLKNALASFTTMNQSHQTRVMSQEEALAVVELECERGSHFVAKVQELLILLKC